MKFRNDLIRRFFFIVVQFLFLGLFLAPFFLEPFLNFLFPNQSGGVLFVRSSLFSLTLDHLILSLSASVVSAVIGIFVGILCTRPAGRDFLPLIRDSAALIQTLPPMVVLMLSIPFLGFGFEPVLLALILYSLLPVLNNTISGLENLSRGVIDAARGMGMSRFQILFKVELPLALPVVGSGIRNSVVVNVGTATIAAFAGAGGLGSPIVAGLANNNSAWILQGAVCSALLALLLNSVFLLAEKGLFPGTRIAGIKSVSEVPRNLKVFTDY